MDKAMTNRELSEAIAPYFGWIRHDATVNCDGYFWSDPEGDAYLELPDLTDIHRPEFGTMMDELYKDGRDMTWNEYDGFQWFVINADDEYGISRLFAEAEALGEATALAYHAMCKAKEGK